MRHDPPRRPPPAGFAASGGRPPPREDAEGGTTASRAPLEPPDLEPPDLEPPDLEPPDLEPPPVELPIDGVLDLHAFRPSDVKDLVPEWLDACRARGILQARIVHGKGTGALRRTVEAILARTPGVASFRAADEAGGGWGATLVTLLP